MTSTKADRVADYLSRCTGAPWRVSKSTDLPTHKFSTTRELQYQHVYPMIAAIDQLYSTMEQRGFPFEQDVEYYQEGYNQRHTRCNANNDLCEFTVEIDRHQLEPLLEAIDAMGRYLPALE